MASKEYTEVKTNSRTISIIGTGDYARALAKRLSYQGFDVVCGSRNPAARNLAKIDKELASVKVTTLADAIQASGTIFVAVPYKGHVDTLKPFESLLAGKILIDISNPNKINKHGISIAEKLSQLLPRSHIIKAFNTVSAYAMEYNYTGVSVEVYICGDSTEARSVVQQLASEMGFNAVEKGGLRVAREIEKIPLQLLPGWGIATIVVFIICLLWIGLMTFLNHYLAKRSWSTFPSHTLNHSIAGISLILLALCYLAGCVAAFKQLCQCTKYKRFPAWLDEWLKMRKQLGLYALFFAGCHSFIAVVLMSAGYFPDLYQDSHGGHFSIPGNLTKDFKVPVGLRMTWNAELFITLGSLAFGVMIIIGITSLPSVGAKMNWREWVFAQSQLGYVCLSLSVAHVFFRGIGDWMSISTAQFFYNTSFLVSVIPWLTLVLKLILLTPCFYIPLMKIRSGWEPCVKYELVSTGKRHEPSHSHDNGNYKSEIIVNNTNL